MSNYRTMTEIGALLGGMTSHQVGKALKELGLRTPGGWPTDKALENELAIEQITDGHYQLYIWEVDRVVPLLKAHLAEEAAK